MDNSAERRYTVTGMTCEHCLSSVREEVGELAGVDAVEVTLATGQLRVRGVGFGDQQVAAAVAEAGYEVAQ